MIAYLTAPPLPQKFIKRSSLPWCQEAHATLLSIKFERDIKHLHLYHSLLCLCLCTLRNTQNPKQVRVRLLLLILFDSRWIITYDIIRMFSQIFPENWEIFDFTNFFNLFCLSDMRHYNQSIYISALVCHSSDSRKTKIFYFRGNIRSNSSFSVPFLRTPSASSAACSLTFSYTSAGAKG